MDIKSQLTQILKTKTVKESSITTLATITNGILGVLFYILIARLLGPSVYGLFAVAIATLTLTSDIANLGTDTGLIRFIGKYHLTDKVKTLKFLKLGLEIKLLVWVLVLVLGWFFVPYLADIIFLKHELITPLRLSLIGVGGALLFSFATSSLQAFQKYRSWSALNIGSNTLRLLIILTLIYLGNLSLQSSLLTFILIPLIGFLVALLLLPRFLLVKNETSVSGEFFHYNKWVALFTLVAAISSRVDIFLVTRFLPVSQVGVYAVATQLTVVVPQLVFAIATVVAPKLASLQTHAQARLYLKKLWLLVLGLAGIGVLVIPVSSYLIPTLLGPSYIQSVDIFKLLFLSQLIFLISLPFHQAIFYYFAKPSVFVLISLIHLAIVGGLGWMLVLNMGVLGAAFAVLIGSISNFLIPAIWVLSKLKKDS